MKIVFPLLIISSISFSQGTQFHAPIGEVDSSKILDLKPYIPDAPIVEDDSKNLPSLDDLNSQANSVEVNTLIQKKDFDFSDIVDPNVTNEKLLVDLLNQYRFNYRKNNDSLGFSLLKEAYWNYLSGQSVTLPMLTKSINVYEEYLVDYPENWKDHNSRRALRLSVEYVIVKNLFLPFVYEARGNIKLLNNDYRGAVTDYLVSAYSHESEESISGDFYLKIGSCFAALNESDNACKYMRKAQNLGVASSFELISKYCQ